MVQKTLTISKDQTLFDVAVQEYGNAQAVLELAIANEISTTELLSPGQIIILPESKLKKDEIVKEFVKNKTKIVTGWTADTSPPRRRGIGYMSISSTFIVS